MPQFDFANPIVWAQLAWLGLAFLILYFGIVRLTLPKLSNMVTVREDQVAGDLSTAERAKGEADAMAAAYAAGIGDAHKAARTAVATAKAKAATSVEKAVTASDSVSAILPVSER